MWASSIKIFSTKYFVSELDFMVLFRHLDSVMFDYVFSTKEKKVLVCAVFDNKHPLYFQMHIKAFLNVNRLYTSYFREVKWICIRSDYSWRYK